MHAGSRIMRDVGVFGVLMLVPFNVSAWVLWPRMCDGMLFRADREKRDFDFDLEFECDRVLLFLLDDDNEVDKVVAQLFRLV